MTFVSSKNLNELGEKLLGGDKSEAIFAARLSWGYFCREATIYLYRTTGRGVSSSPRPKTLRVHFARYRM